MDLQNVDTVIDQCLTISKQIMNLGLYTLNVDALEANDTFI